MAYFLTESYEWELKKYEQVKSIFNIKNIIDDSEYQKLLDTFLEEQRFNMDPKKLKLKLKRYKQYYEYEKELTNPTYKFKDRIVAFLDILGFTNMILNNSIKAKKVTDMLAKKFQQIKDKKTIEFFRNSDENLIPEDILDGIELGITSDSIFISAYNNKSSFDNLIKLIMQIQLELLIEGFILRGGISEGELYQKDTIIIGEPLVIAHYYEDVVCSNPKVIIDETLKNKFNVEQELFKPCTCKYDYKDKEYTKDMFYLDYLNPRIYNWLFNYMDDGPTRYSDALLKEQIKLKNSIESLYNKYKNSTTTVITKYKWLIEKYNDILNSENFYCPQKIDDLRIKLLD